MLNIINVPLIGVKSSHYILNQIFSSWKLCMEFWSKYTDFLKIFLIIYLFTLHPSYCFSDKLSSSLREWRIYWYLPNLVLQAFPTEAREGSPVKGSRSSGRQQIQGQPLLQVLGELHENQAVHLLHTCLGPIFSSQSHFVWQFSLWKAPRIQGGSLCLSSC